MNISLIFLLICIFCVANSDIEVEETNDNREPLDYRNNREIRNNREPRNNKESAVIFGRNKERKGNVFITVDKHGSIESMSNGGSITVFTRNGNVIVYSSMGDMKVPLSDAPFVITNNEDGDGLIVRPMTKEDEEMMERKNMEVRDRIFEGQRRMMKSMHEMHRMMQERMASMFRGFAFDYE